jgi:hypothetical protein
LQQNEKDCSYVRSGWYVYCPVYSESFLSDNHSFCKNKTGIPQTIQHNDEIIAVQNSKKEFMNGISINPARAFTKKI